MKQKNFFKRFTGARWYRKLELDDRGSLIPAGPLRNKSRSECFRAFFADGQIHHSEWHDGGKFKGLKFYSLDGQGRVAGITLVQQDKVIDTWHYVYGKNGKRKLKLIAYPGKQPHKATEYPS
jgi:hypothetical protein